MGAALLSGLMTNAFGQVQPIQSVAQPQTRPEADKDNTVLYVSLGFAGLLLLIGAVYLFTRK